MATAIAKRITGYSVVQPGAAEAAPSPPASVDNDAQQRIVIEASNGPAPALPMERRPRANAGHRGMTFRIDAPGDTVYVTINELDDSPFEIFVRAKRTRGLESLAQSLSMDLRSGDRRFIRRKLMSLSRVTDTPFDMQLPDGESYRMPGITAAIARLVIYRCEELWATSDESDRPSPLFDALCVKREPKTTTSGTIAWAVDVYNPATEDDFKLFLAEATQGGKVRPYSLWIDGDFRDETYRHTLRAICKSLSIDLQVGPLAWAGKKLRQLLEYAEPRADFMAAIPGSEKRTTYASTEAYLATLVLWKLSECGLLRADGYPLESGNVIPMPIVIPDASDVARGAHCGSCGAYAVTKVDGCLTCRSCGNSSCG